MDLKDVLVEINGFFDGFQPWQLVLGTAFFIHILHALMEVVKYLASNSKVETILTIKKLNNDISSDTNLKAAAFRLFRKLPFVQGKINAELDKTVKEMEQEVTDQIGGMSYNRTLPANGYTKAQVLQEIDQIMALGEFKAETGALSGTCHKPPNLNRVSIVTEAYSKTAYANPLNPDAFPGIRKMEAEVVRMCCNLFNGDPDHSCGTMTSGGTESLILACKSYRDYGKKIKGISTPNIVMPVSQR